jgi:hypothetical protein
MFKIHNDKVKELIGIDYAKATYQRFMTTKLHVEDFLKTKKKSDILIRDMNNGFLKDFDHYLKTKKKIDLHHYALKIHNEEDYDEGMLETKIDSYLSLNGKRSDLIN